MATTEEQGRRKNGRAVYYMARDLVQWLVGLAILAHQTLYAKEPNLSLLGVALALIGMPGAIGAVNLLLAGRGTPPGTTSSPSTSPATSSQQHYS